MAHIVYDNPDDLIKWAEARTGFVFRDDARAIGLQRQDLCAVVVYDTFSQCDVSMHIASDGTGHWLNRAYLRAAFMHPFGQWGLRRVTGVVPAKNKRALRFDLHLGFAIEGVCRDALPDDDAIILGMTRAQCRFIPQEVRHA